MAQEIDDKKDAPFEQSHDSEWRQRVCGREGGFARQRGKISQEGDSLTSSGGSQLRQLLSDFGGEGACNF